MHRSGVEIVINMKDLLIKVSTSCVIEEDEQCRHMFQCLLPPVNRHCGYSFSDRFLDMGLKPPSPEFVKVGGDEQTEAVGGGVLCMLQIYLSPSPFQVWN